MLAFKLPRVLKRNLCIFPLRGMFKMIQNPKEGKMEWLPVSEDYDYHQEVARSAYADMLHDYERNEKYHVALRAAIKKMHMLGKPAHVLDIGTGTGLLAMMAANCGADSVVACEAFQPMAKCAAKVIADNNLAEKILIIPKRSTEIKVGKGGDMSFRANILVTEVFDTELIGEGAIGTFNHAKKELLEPNSIVVPSEATIYAQIVECPLALAWHRPLKWVNKDENVVISPPSKVLQCAGGTDVHDLQLSQLSENSFRSLVPPTPVFRFDWSCKDGLIPTNRSESIKVVASRPGTVQAVFMWWDLKMDEEGEVILSCAPFWAHPNFKDRKPSLADSGLPWRDHWMQAIYYLPSEISMKEGEEGILKAHHDEYSLWFNFQNSISADSVEKEEQQPACKCGHHATFGRARIGAFNDENRRVKYAASLEKCLKQLSKKLPDEGTSIFLCISEASFVGLYAAKLAEKYCRGKKFKVVYEDSNSRAKEILKTWIAENELEDSVSIVEDIATDKLLRDNKVQMVFGEQSFYRSLLPWHHLCFWFKKDTLSHLIPPEAVLLPRGATIWAMPVSFVDLWKIRAPVHSAEGFKMESFDQLIELSRSIGDDQIEPQPLWEYPCTALSRPFQLFQFDFQQPYPSETVVTRGTFKNESAAKDCNGVAFWVQWDLDGENSITTGPLSSPSVGETVSWDIHTRQGVRLFPSPLPLPFNFEARFLSSTCDISMSIETITG